MPAKITRQTNQMSLDFGGESASATAIADKPEPITKKTKAKKKNRLISIRNIFFLIVKLLYQLIF